MITGFKMVEWSWKFGYNKYGVFEKLCKIEFAKKTNSNTV